MLAQINRHRRHIGMSKTILIIDNFPMLFHYLGDEIDIISKGVFKINVYFVSTSRRQLLYLITRTKHNNIIIFTFFCLIRRLHYCQRSVKFLFS